MCRPPDPIILQDAASNVPAELKRTTIPDVLVGTIAALD